MADVTKIKLPDNSTVNIKDYRIPGVDTEPTSGSDNLVTSGGVYKDIEDASRVTSAALNDLNDRLTTVEDGGDWVTTEEFHQLEGVAKDTYTIAEVDALLDNLENQYVSEETDPTVPAWAKAPNKPTYTANEVGALSSSTVIPTKVSDLTNDSNFTTKTYVDAIKYASSKSVGGPADKAVSIPFATVAGTSTATAFTATIDGITELRDGICFYLRNNKITSASGWTLNINGLGAKPVYLSDSSSTRCTTQFENNGYYLFIYNTARVQDGCFDLCQLFDTNNIYTNASLGHGYGTCSTAYGTAAKAVICSGYVLTTGGYITVNFTNDVDANATLNVNGKGAKAIYYQGAAIGDKVIKAGDTALFIYNTYYYLVSIDRGGGTNTVTSVNVGSTAYNPTNGVVSLPAYPTAIWEIGTGTNSVIVANSLGTANGNYSTVEGYKSITGGNYETNTISVSVDTSAGSFSHAEGAGSIASGMMGSHAEGFRTLANGGASHAEGMRSISSGDRSHAEGTYNISSGNSAHAEGSDTIASGKYSHAEGFNTIAKNQGSHAEGGYNIASGLSAHAEGNKSSAIGEGSHAEGLSIAVGNFSHSENGTKGMDVFPVGNANATTYTSSLDSEWDSLRTETGDTIFCNIIKSSTIHLKGSASTSGIIKITDASLSGNTLTFSTEKTLSQTALDGTSVYWINMSIAYGMYSHSENEGNTSYGKSSHAGGNYTVALGDFSYTEGVGTISKNVSEHAQGSYNISNKVSDTYGNAGNTQHSIGIGSESGRKNAIEVMQNGDMYVYGVGSYTGTNYSSASTLQSVLNNIPAAQVQSDWNATSGMGVILNKPTIPAAVTESTVSGWGFTKNTGTLTTETDPVFSASAAAGITASDITNWNGKTSNTGTVTGVKINGTTKNPTSGVVDLGTVLTSYTETDPTVPSWAKASSKPTYTASEVGALPDTTSIPTESTVSGWGFTKNAAPGTLKTNATTAQTASSGEAMSGTITLHKIAKTGTYSDLIGTPTIPTKVSDLTNDSNFTSNTGTVTGVKINGTTKTPTSGTVDLGTVLTSETSLSKGTTTGSGNAVTDISVSGHQITLTKGSTFLTSETSLSKGTTTGSGNAVTDISVSGHQITLTKGTTFLTSHQDISGKASLSGAAFTGTVTGTSSGNTAQFRNVTISSSEPTASDGNNGDIWIVI